MLLWYSVPWLMANLITVQVDKSGRRLPFDLVVWVEDLGVPQHRVRLFLVCTRSKAPLNVQMTKS